MGMWAAVVSCGDWADKDREMKLRPTAIHKEMDVHRFGKDCMLLMLLGFYG